MRRGDDLAEIVTKSVCDAAESEGFQLRDKDVVSMCPDAIKNIETMESFMDCWCNIPGYDSPTDFLKSFITYEIADNKMLWKAR